MTSNPIIVLSMIIFVAFLISLSKGGLGGMLGALATPMLVLVMPANQVLGLLLPILLLADAFAIALHWGKWNRRLVWLLIPGALIGVTPVAHHRPKRSLASEQRLSPSLIIIPS